MCVCIFLENIFFCAREHWNLNRKGGKTHFFFKSMVQNESNIQLKTSVKHTTISTETHTDTDKTEANKQQPDGNEMMTFNNFLFDLINPNTNSKRKQKKKKRSNETQISNVYNNDVVIHFHQQHHQRHHFFYPNKMRIFIHKSERQFSD